jgi:type IV pilus assembly protein PilC
MPLYSYEALNTQGRIVGGTVNSHSPVSAVEGLRRSGLSVLELNEKKVKVKVGYISNKRKNILQELSLFSRQLAVMLNAGITLTKSIFALSKQNAGKPFGAALADIAGSIESGGDISDAFEKHPKIFDKMYVSMLKAGETGGTLGKSLERLSVQLQKDKRLKDNIKTATLYPKLVGGFAVIMFLAMMLLLVPVFKGMIPDGAELPGITAFIFKASDSMRGYPVLWLLSGGLLAASIMIFMRSKTGHDLWERLKMRAPFIGKLVTASVSARFARTLSTLLEGGIPVIQALKIAGPTSGSDILAEAALNSAKLVEEGETISQSLEKSGLFPPMMIQMISVGEETGALPSLLDNAAEFYEEEVASMSAALGTILEPVILVVVGLLVGGMLIALYLPMFTSITSSFQ